MAIKLNNPKFARDLRVTTESDPSWMLACARTARAMTSAAAILHKDLGAEEAELADIILTAETLLNVHDAISAALDDLPELRGELNEVHADTLSDGHDCDDQDDGHLCEHRKHVAAIIASTLEKLTAEELAGVASDSQPSEFEERCGFIHASPDMSKTFHAIFRAVGEMSYNGSKLEAATQDMDPRYGDAVFFCTTRAHGVPSTLSDIEPEAQAKLREYILRRVSPHSSSLGAMPGTGRTLHDCATAPSTRFERFQFGVKMYPFRNIN